MGGFPSPTPYRRSPLISDFAPYDPSRDPRDMFPNERARATAWGDIAEQEYQDLNPNFLNLEEGYRRRGDQLYDDLLQNPGYNDEDINRIVREQELIQMGYTPEEAQAQMLTENEQSQIRGDPYQPLQALNGEQNFQIAREGGQRQREAITDSSGRIRSATMDPALLQSEGYGGTQRGTVGTLDRNVRAAIDPTTLRLDQEFAENYPISDEEIRQAEQLAARSSRQPFNTAFDEAERRAAAAGSVPGAIAASGGRLARQAAVEAGDAATKARLGGLDLQRSQRRDLEGMRLDTERDLSGRLTDAEFGLADTRLGTEADIERGRISAAQGRAGLITDSEGNLLAERTGAERFTNQANADAARFNQGMAFEGLAQGEGNLADRNAAIAQNRQGGTRYAQETGYGRGLDINDRLSGRYTDVAGARRADQQEGRGYTTGQQQQAGARQSDVAQQRLTARQIAQQGSLGATGGAADYDIARRSAPNFWTKNVLPTLNAFSNMGNSAANMKRAGMAVPMFEGGIVDEPTLAMIGEGGEEEYVIPQSKMPEVSMAVQRALNSTRPAMAQPQAKTWRRRPMGGPMGSYEFAAG